MMNAKFSQPVLGHWDTDEGTEMANRSLGETRAELSMGHLTDLQVANGVYLASRHDLDLVVWQTAAKERIRWLSAQLALANGAAAPEPSEATQAAADVLAERRRQIEAEGWTPLHDDQHGGGQMARAAACYALSGSTSPDDTVAALLVSLAWPWDQQWWKPTNRRRDLVKAGALILAEIERLDLAAAAREQAKREMMQ